MCAAPSEQECNSAVSLLSLPDVLLHEVLSWSHDSATANALLSTCLTLRSSQHDPAAAALLLLRCSTCEHPGEALTSCGTTCHGGTAAVVRQVLHRLHAGNEPCRSPQRRSRLLQALLCASAAAGHAADIRTLMSLPVSPALDADKSQAILAAVRNGHLAATQTLLDLGAFSAFVSPDPALASPRYSAPACCLAEAAARPACVALLPLLIQHCPRWALAEGLNWSLHCAVVANLADTVALLLPLLSIHSAAPDQTRELLSVVLSAVAAGHTTVLRLLLAHWTLTPPQLDRCLRDAVHKGKARCVELLLDAGATVNPASTCLLWHGVSSLYQDDPTEREEAVLDVLQVLVRRGASVSATVRTAAALRGNARVTAFLRSAKTADRHE